MSYYESGRPWPAVGQNAWNDVDIDGQTIRSGASSTVPGQAPPPPSQGQDGAAFSHQLEEVDRAIDNLVKSGKMFGMPGRREWFPPPTGPARKHPGFDGRQAHGMGARPHSMAEFGDARGAHQSNLQNFYASQRHQSSRGSNEAEQMIQAKRRMAAQRERELRNYHQEQQYNRTVLAEISSFGGKPDRTLSPNSMSEADRRDLIARQRSALYGEGQFGETGGYVDETGTPRQGVPGAQHHGPTTSIRGHSPLAYEYGRPPPTGGPPVEGSGPRDGGSGSPSSDPNQRSRANSAASPQPNVGGSNGNDQSSSQLAQISQQVSRTSNSSPGASSLNSKQGADYTGSAAVAPIGTRPLANAAGQPTTSTMSTASNPAFNSKRSTTPLASPLSHGFTASGTNGDNVLSAVGAAPTNASSTTPDVTIGVSGWGSRGGSVWGNSGKSGMGVQASVWG
ncbi:hypothetical protein SPI_05515 [Niveomyces insectorum RCEF 264]|uniref:Uncharacterized protein n=1 Tax=Niveomyces insectorum RCEF 264 TaxID=1081102 RepID=A0A167TAJ6_9HYPO|nr:hypothetical protein SPI_05515 [Niveomyces insectorum RCEF 264]